VYEKANERYRKLRRKLRDYALAELEGRGLGVRKNGSAETKAQSGAVRPPVEERGADSPKPSGLN
jgi:hypothetical protein